MFIYCICAQYLVGATKKIRDITQTQLYLLLTVQSKVKFVGKRHPHIFYITISVVAAPVYTSKMTTCDAIFKYMGKKVVPYIYI